MRAISQVALALALVTATTGLTAPTASAGEKCGYFTARDAAYYKHCGPTRVMIHIDTVWAPDDDWCVGPWTITHLGKWTAVRNAWYTRPC